MFFFVAANQLKCHPEQLKKFLRGKVGLKNQINEKNENSNTGNNANNVGGGQVHPGQSSMEKRDKCILDVNNEVCIITRCFIVPMQNPSLRREYGEDCPLDDYFLDYAQSLVALHGIKEIFASGKTDRKLKRTAEAEEKKYQQQEAKLELPHTWEHQTCLRDLLLALLNYVRIIFIVNATFVFI